MFGLVQELVAREQDCLCRALYIFMLPLSVGDLTEETASEDDKPLDSVALAKFLSKAAAVTNRLYTFITCC